MPPYIIRCWLTGYIGHLWGSAWARNPRKEMPADPIEGLQWIVPKLLKDLTEAKMWPIKMVQVKHQETLRDSHAPNCGIIHLYIYIPFSYYLKNTLSMYHQKSYLFFRVVGCCWIWGDTLLAQSKGLETTFFEMKHYLDQYKEDSLVELGWAMSFHPFQCNSHHLCCRNLSCVHYRKTFYG